MKKHWYWTLCPKCGRKKSKIEFHLEEEEFNTLTDEVKKLCLDCYTKWKFLKNMGRLELTTGISRIYVEQFNPHRFKGNPGEDKTPQVVAYLNKTYKLKIETVLDIIPCEKRFGYNIYYK